MESLSPWQSLDLAGRVAEACASKYRAIAGSVEPRDQALRDLMGALESGARSQAEGLRRIQGGVERGGTPALAPGDLQAFLHRHFPSIRARFGEGYLERDSAMYFAECLKEESIWFYRSLAAAAADPEARHCFEKAAQGEWGRLEQLRTVLL